MLVLTLALATFSARGQEIGVQYYYSPEPTFCSGETERPCSIVECRPGWKNCACPLVLPNGWKRPLSKEQCDAASRTLPLYRPEEEVPRRLAPGQTKDEASGSPKAGAAKPTKKKPVSLPDETTCRWVGVGGGGKPIICRYNCDGVENTIEVLLPDSMSKCPGEVSNPLKWKEIKRFPQRL